MTTADVVASAINLFALLFLGAQVWLARKALKDAAAEQRKEWVRQRRRASIDMMTSTSQYRERLKASLPWNDRDPEVVAAFLEEVGGDLTRLTPLREYLNHLEDLAVGVKQEVYDTETVSMLEGRRIIDLAKSYRPYIEAIRKELNRPGIYEDILDLAEIMRASVPDEDSGTVPMGGPAESAGAH